MELVCIVNESACFVFSVIIPMLNVSIFVLLPLAACSTFFFSAAFRLVNSLSRFLSSLMSCALLILQLLCSSAFLLASRRAAMRDWRESRRFLIMRSLVWYSDSLVLTHAAQQEWRLDPSQSAQLLLLPPPPRRDAIIARPNSTGGKRRRSISGRPARGGAGARERRCRGEGRGCASRLRA